ncbi:MAG: LCP family protein [Anaerolineae bacterium]|nr:LCP family protein [Anaerolineae bacterium]
MHGSDLELSQLVAYLETLGRLGDSQTVPELLSALSHKEPLVRQVAVTSLGRIADVAAVSALLVSLRDPQPNVRQAAAWSLGQIGHKRAAGGLLEALQDTHADTRRAAAWSLGCLGDKCVLPNLCAARQDPDEGVRHAAARAVEMLEGVRAHEPCGMPDRSFGTSSASLLAGRVPDRRGKLSLLYYGLRAGLIGLGIVAVGLSIILIVVALNWERSMGPDLVALESTGEPVVVDPMPTPAGKPVCGGPPVMMLLLVGSDAPSSDFATGFADVIRIARIDFVSRSVVLLAVPRDLWVPIPGLEAQGIVNNRLKTAYTYGQHYAVPGGGPSLLAQTLALNFGLQVDHYVIVSFAAFEEGVDAIGGIDLYLTEPFDAPDGFRFPAGWQHMDGKTALSYARFRPDNSSDLGRIERQTQVIAAIREQVFAPQPLTSFPDLVSSLRDSVLTDLSPAEFSPLMCLGRQIDSDDIETITIEGDMVVSVTDHYGHERLLPNSEAIRRFVHAFNRGESVPATLPLGQEP